MALKQGSSRETGKKKAGSSLMTGGNQQSAGVRAGKSARNGRNGQQQAQPQQPKRRSNRIAF